MLAVSMVSFSSMVGAINSSYVSRLLRVTLLAPNIVEAILDGRQPADMTLALLMQPFVVLWAEQSGGLGGAERKTFRQTRFIGPNSAWAIAKFANNVVPA